MSGTRAKAARWSTDPGRWVDFLVPALACAAWLAAIAAAADDDRARQGTIFLGAPLVLLAGLHARLSGYLHERARITLLPLPLSAKAHWSAAKPRHHRGLVSTVLLGSLAIVVSLWESPSLSISASIFDWLWLCTFAGLLEPLIPALGSFLGRRHPANSTAGELQRTLAGGWTLPETAIHLWAPAGILMGCAAMALPGQLAVDRLAMGKTVGPTFWTVAFLPLPLAAMLRGFSVRLYARGLFEAVPWLAEAQRTLTGPPRPEPTPGWVRYIRDPVRRLLVIQLLRATPVPLLRLALLVAFAAWLSVRREPPGAGATGLALALVGIWLVPMRSLVAERPRRAKMLAPLPLPEQSRRGRDPWFSAWVFVPVAAVSLVFAVRWSIAR